LITPARYGSFRRRQSHRQTRGSEVDVGLSFDSDHKSTGSDNPPSVIAVTLECCPGSCPGHFQKPPQNGDAAQSQGRNATKALGTPSSQRLRSSRRRIGTRVHERAICARSGSGQDEGRNHCKADESAARTASWEEDLEGERRVISPNWESFCVDP
jgi:hypothetical protein